MIIHKKMFRLLLKINIKALYIEKVEDLQKDVLNHKVFVKKVGSSLNMNSGMKSFMMTYIPRKLRPNC